MDRALKERVVGATVLVVIAVLVVPVFLDGPPDEREMVTETVRLPGQSEQNSKRQTIVLERDRDEPVPSTGVAPRDENAEAVTPATRPARQVAQGDAGKRTERPAPTEMQTPKPRQATTQPAAGAGDAMPAATPGASTTGMWAVQLGSFSSQANAERLAADLRKEGYAAFLSRVQTNSKVLHRVRVGPQQDRAGAEKVAARLAGEGHKGQVVPHP